jgi:predicted transposase/invertase (TIGR01784 family)
LKGKSVYYVCDLHSSQSSKGKAYDELAKSYQITFCAYTVFPMREAFVNSYSLRHDIDNELLHDAIHVMFVELSKLDEILKKPVAEMTDMDKWGIFFRYAENPKCLDVVNEVIESKEALTVASTLLIGISQSEKERAIFRSRRMYQSDLESNLRVAERTGRKEVARKILSRGFPVEEVVECTMLPREEVELLAIPDAGPVSGLD